MFNSILRRINDIYRGYKYNKIAEQLPIDANIKYPSYKSMDEFIDIEHLKSLDGILNKVLVDYLNNPLDEDYCKYPLGPSRYFYAIATPKLWQPKTTRSHFILLSKNTGQYNYLDYCEPKKWKPTPFVEKVPELMAFIKTLPFQATGRIMLMFDKGDTAVAAHRDHVNPNLCHEFIWFRTNLKKKFFVLSHGEKLYFSSYSGWFDTVNQFHGADPAGELNLSIRVDGIFDDRLRKLIPKPTLNLASTPSLWATLTENEK